MSDTKAGSPSLPRALATITISVAAMMCGWLILLHLRMIVSPAPQEIREGALVWITQLLLDGRNPYAIDELPAGANNYGILYHLVVLPFASVFGNGYTVHRVIAALAIAGSCGIMYRLLRRERTDILLSIAGVMLFYIVSLYFVGPTARPDALAVLLCTASMAILFRQDVMPYRFLAGLSLALLALLTKFYLAYPPFITSAYVFLFESKRRGLIYGLLTILAVAGTLEAMTVPYPAYITVSLVLNSETTNQYNLAYLRSQTKDWLVYSLPLAVAIAIAVSRYFTCKPARSDLKRPNIFVFGSILNAGIFFWRFGGAHGAHMTYLFHLVTPVLIVALLPRFTGTLWPRATLAMLLPLSFAWNSRYFPLTFSQFTPGEQAYARFRTVIGLHQNVLGSPQVAGELALAGRPVIDSGHSEYFSAAAVESSIPGLLPAAVVRERWHSYLADITEGISSHRYDLIVRDQYTPVIPENLVRQHYMLVENVSIDYRWGFPLYLTLELWKPREAIPASH